MVSIVSSVNNPWSIASVTGNNNNNNNNDTIKTIMRKTTTTVMMMIIRRHKVYLYKTYRHGHGHNGIFPPYQPTSSTKLKWLHGSVYIVIVLSILQN